MHKIYYPALSEISTLFFIQNIFEIKKFQIFKNVCGIVYSLNEIFYFL